MSLVVRKFEPGGKTKEPRLYKRGNDDVDLDAYIRDAESGFGFWLANSGLKDKLKKEVLAAFLDILTGINSGEFTYNIGGGFSNTRQVTNSTKGFDAYGLAAGYLGNVLRNQELYSAPASAQEEGSDRIAWTGTSSMGRDLTRYLYNGDSGNIRSVIDLDPVEADGKRKTTQRALLLSDYITDRMTNFDKYFSGYTDSARDKQIQYLQQAQLALKDGVISENEYLTLERAFGTDLNLRQMFYTGKLKDDGSFANNTAVVPDVLNPAEPVAISEQEWRNLHYPRRNFSNPINRSLHDDARYGKWARDRFDEYLDSLSENVLVFTLNLYLRNNPSNAPLKTIPVINLFYQLNAGKVPEFSNEYVLGRMLAVLRENKRALDKYTSGNYIYIPKTYSKSRGTGLVWDIGNRTISELSIYDIPFWINKMRNEYVTQVPLHKKGGIFRFLAGGPFSTALQAITYLDEDLADNLRLRNNYANGAFTFSQRTDKATDATNPNNGMYDPEAGGKQLEQQQYYKDWTNILTSNAQVAEAWARRYRDLRANDTMLHSDPWFSEDGTFNFEEFKKSNIFRDGINGIGHDVYRGRAYQIQGQDGFYQNILDGYELVEGDPTLDDSGLVNIYLMVKKEPVAEQVEEPVDENNPLAVRRAVVNSKPKEGDPDPVKDLLDPKKKLEEKHLQLPALLTSVNTSNIWSDISADLLGAGRLGWSLHTNKRVRDTLMASLNPVLKDTFEKYSPVTGAFSERLYWGREAADTERLGSQIAHGTSDSSLAAAAMLDANRQATDLRYRGFLADDKEMRRTAEQALGRQEDNAARRSEVANFNRASINQTIRERAQLDASRLKLDWQSVDNYLAGVESRTRARIEENRTRANNLGDRIVQENAANWRALQMEYINADLQKWRSNPDNANKPISEWDEYKNGNYQAAIRYIDRMANAMVYQDMSNRYSLGYRSDFTPDSYNESIWKNRWTIQLLNGENNA